MGAVQRFMKMRLQLTNMEKSQRRNYSNNPNQRKKIEYKMKSQMVHFRIQIKYQINQTQKEFMNNNFPRNKKYS